MHPGENECGVTYTNNNWDAAEHERRGRLMQAQEEARERLAASRWEPKMIMVILQKKQQLNMKQHWITI